VGQYVQVKRIGRKEAEGTLERKNLQDLHAVSALIAATIHDLDHPGRGNAFLVNTRQKLALLYNDHSVLENHHVALAFQLTLSQTGVNIFAKLSRDEFTQMRHSAIDMVLATDMSRHFEYLTKFSQLLGALPNVFGTCLGTGKTAATLLSLLKPSRTRRRTGTQAQ
jgi:hypothetical protein